METVQSSGRTFQVQNEQVKENSARGEYDLFLYFADQVVFGPDEDGSEGLVVALDSSWRSELGDLQFAVASKDEGRSSKQMHHGGSLAKGKLVFRAPVGIPPSGGYLLALQENTRLRAVLQRLLSFVQVLQGNGW